MDDKILSALITTEPVETNESISELDGLTKSTLNALPGGIAILDASGKIIFVNEVWRLHAEANNPVATSYGIGTNYLEVCESADSGSEEEARQIAQGIREVMSCQRDEFYVEYPCHNLTERRWFSVRATRVNGYDPVRVVVAHDDVTEQKTLEEEREKIINELDERVKELTALHKISLVLQDSEKTISEVLREITFILPSAWQYPEITAARIVFDMYEFTTPNFYPTPWKQSADFETTDGKRVVVEIVYLAERPSEYEAPFLIEERSLINSLSEMLHTYLERKLIEDDLKENVARLAKKTRYEEIISTVARGIHQSIELQDVLENAVESLSKSVDKADKASVYLVEGKDAMLKAYRGYSASYLEQAIRIPFPKGASWKTIIDGKPRYVADVEQDKVIGPAGKEAGTKSYLSVPIRFRGKTVGCVHIHSSKKNAFDEEELKLLEIVAHQIESAINNSQQAKALRESEEQYRVLFEQSSVGVFIFDKEFMVTQCNKRLVEIMESDFDNLMGLNLLELRDQSFIPALHRALEGQSSYYEGFYEATTSAAKLWLSLRLSPLRDADGEMVGGMGIVEDISERKQKEIQLHLNKTALEATANGIVITDRGGTIVWVNPAVTVLTGYTADEVIGQSTCIFNSGKQDIAFYQDLWNTILSGQVWQGEMINRRKDGNLYTEEMTITPVRFGGDEITHFIAVKQDITERKLAEEELHKSEERFQVVSQATSDAVWDWDLVTNKVWYNENIQTLFGYPLDKVGLDLSWWTENLHPEDKDGVVSSIYEVIHSDESYWSSEYRYRCADGDYAFVLDRGYVIRNEQGNPIRMIGSMMDVTERKQIEEALKEGQERLELALKGGDLGLWDWNVQTGYMAFNDRWAEMLGYSSEEIDKHISSWEKMVHPEDMPYVAEILNAHLEGRLPFYEAEYRIKCKDGDLKWILDRGRVFERDKDEKPLRATGTFLDITKRKLAEEKIREQATLLDVARDSIMVRDLEHRVTYWNKSAERLYGWAAEETIGKNALDFLFRRDVTPVYEAHKSVIEKGEWAGELHQVTKGGREIVVDSHWTIVRDEEGNPKSIFIVNTDITEKKKLETQFLRSQRMESIGTLAGGIAHDLNNVFQPIMMVSQLLRMKFTDVKSQNLIETLETSAERGANLVKQVLSFARGVEGEHAILQVRHIISEITKILKETFPKSIEITNDVPRDLWPISADPTQLHQILMNLCVNARDAMPDGGTLKISGGNFMVDENYARMNIEAKSGPYIVINVTDSGVGIPAEIIERIFEPFFTTKEPGKGTGLGLSTTFRIVKDYGGFIRVYSEVDKGTKFSIYLPAVDTTEIKNLAKKERENLPAGHGELLLIVDDEISVREIAGITLETKGYKVITANDGAEAIALYAQNRRDVKAVILDVVMPIMDGPACIRALRKIDPDVKIIVASGLKDNSNLVKVGDTEIAAFLTKPYTTETLLKTLQEVLGV